MKKSKKPEFENIGGQRVQVEENTNVHYSTTHIIISLIINYDDLIYALHKDPQLEKFIYNLKEY